MPLRLLSGFISVFLLALFTESVSAQGIDGFQDFKVGMTVSQVEKIASISPSSREEKGQWFRNANEVEIIGEFYTQEFLFNVENLLVQVNVYREFEAIDVSCTNEFEESFGAIRATYGEPDEPAERKIFGGVAAMTSVRFSRSDGSRVILMTNFLDKCLVHVAYVGAAGGASF